MLGITTTGKNYHDPALPFDALESSFGWMTNNRPLSILHPGQFRSQTSSMQWSHTQTLSNLSSFVQRTDDSSTSKWRKATAVK